MRSLFALMTGAALLLTGCGAKEEAPTPKTTTPATPTATNQGSANPLDDATAVLDSLTQAVRKFGAEKQRVPKNLEEVVAAGYIKTLPEPPPGKKFSIDTKRMTVILE